MTALRPERESAPYGGEAAYGGAESFEAESFESGAPFGDTAEPRQWAAQQAPQYSPGDWYGQQPYGRQSFESYEPRPQAQYDGPYEAYATPAAPGGLQADIAQEHPPIDEETVALRVEEARRLAAAAEPIPAPAPPGGRAARRKAARRHGRHGGPSGAHAGSGAAQGPQEALGADGAVSPGSRIEARRAARAQKPSAGVIASRLIGEVFITTGVVMLLFVTYQLWWSNIRAHQQAGREATSLQEEWKSGKRAPGAFEPGQGFAILHIPKLDVVVPIAEGISKSKVLDRGMVGHYDENSIKTAMPEDKTGNFGIAGHRNTHGEPFRYINRLKPGDPIVVETQDKYYVYDMASILPVTPPSNVSVLNAVPPGSGFTAPGRYITLTTCTPEFTSKYRMIVWGKMVEERPRSEGKPDALVQ
ncbi:class E sortase [Streptomyces griseiscabiei]|uniref:Class E sortase n=1 Tax=Streptomyces griseiscabiei TaxID=2993540 RepID=A0ABU4LAH4_9ACTN|nr:class E sortase [Streptomyces griseiscabiei]MDX2912737.1 class E sortase [Streptomyces griseiscabiei]